MARNSSPTSPAILQRRNGWLDAESVGKKMTKYKRRGVEKAIVLALRNLGGSASRKAIWKEIADSEIDGLNYEQVYYQKQTKKGSYSPFLFDFNFSLKNLQTVGYVEPLRRKQDVVLTTLGRSADINDYPNEQQQQAIGAYWAKKNALRAEKYKRRAAEKKAKETNAVSSPETNESESAVSAEVNDSDNAQEVADNDWQTKLLNQIKQFSPAKFESFSRLLISKMGVKIDKVKGVKLSGDHGIDGFGYFQSDEFRTSRVAIQCKRYIDHPVGESEIRDFKGTMDSFNAEYGIFVTTSFYTDSAKNIATQGTRTVTLIDGQGLCDLVEKYQLHISPVTTYTLDDYYYEKD